MGGWMHGRMVGYTYGQTDGSSNRWMEESMFFLPYVYKAKVPKHDEVSEYPKYDNSQSHYLSIHSFKHAHNLPPLLIRPLTYDINDGSFICTYIFEIKTK